MLRNFLTAVKENLIYVVVASLVAGLAFGQVAGTGTRSLLKAAVLPVLFLMIYPMMINIDLKEVINLRRHAKPVGLSLIVNFAVAPLVAVGLARTFFAGNPAYAVGLYFIALIPTSGMTAAWTGLADGDLEAALVAMAVNLLAAVAILPAYLSVLVPASVAFDPTALYRQLAQVVVLPMVAGNLTRRVLLRQYGSDGFTRLKPMFGGLSSVGVMLIVFIAMTMRSQSILADPVASASTIVPLVVFYAVILVVGAGLGQTLLDTERGVSLVYATSMRNLSIALAIVVAAGSVPAEAILPIALAYILQPPLGAAYMHYRRDVVGEGLTLREAVADLV
ncbi:transporter [Halorubrum ezzemoulense]|uniref:Arsenic resistance protein n=1 Tax=Halorubrum ezzemoulense TaxID=337243 RepID=A0A256ILE2_HALEZ|nr:MULTISPECIES: arsenic resistance protein [Halorubrum]OYR57283.1 transporter [Halorubrum ezzemoulense]OYR76260.1 transporter [Halorubrum ezzemoulense]PHQ41502.1 transporter [Halorubrum sp. C191]QAY21478.1 arsenic resistance protein [Halorubrum ezzemoulense]TKX42769.1 arsenic resistance protein [Halorubrum sp. SD690R]